MLQPLKVHFLKEAVGFVPKLFPTIPQHFKEPSLHYLTVQFQIDLSDIHLNPLTILPRALQKVN
jgi:hypothetical protein